MVYAPLGRHSAKPAVVRHRLDQLYGDVPRIELFARQAAEGWDAWGLEAPNPAVVLRPGTARQMADMCFPVSSISTSIEPMAKISTSPLK
jgi:hypothetical protein